MAFFIVTMTHPAGEGWGRHVAAHVRYLQELVRSGELRASGPLKGTPKRVGFLIFKAACREDVDALVANDPFAIEGLIETLTVFEWDPLFGALPEKRAASCRASGAFERETRSGDASSPSRVTT